MEKPKNSKTKYADAAIYILAFFLIYTAYINARSFWLDEGAVITLANTGSVRDTIVLMNRTGEVHPPLYFILIHYVLRVIKAFKLFRLDHFLLRIPSILASLGSAIFTYLLAKKLFDEKTAKITAVLFLLSSFFIKYSAQVRMYPFLVLFWTASFYFLWKSAEEEGIWNYAFLTIFNTLAVYTHYFGFLMIGSQMLFLLLFFRDYKTKLKLYLISWVITGVLYIPWSPFLLKQSGRGTFMYENPPGILRFIDNIIYLWFGDLSDVITRGNSIAIYLLGAFIISILIYFARTSAKKPAALVIVNFLPFIAMFILGHTSSFILFYGHYFLYLIPFLLIITAYLASRALYKKKGVVLTVILLLIIMGFNGFSYYKYSLSEDSYYGSPNWRGVVGSLSQTVNENDLVIVHPSMFYVVFNIYYRGPAQYRLVDDPAVIDEQMVANKNRIFVVTIPHHPVSNRMNMEKYMKRSFRLVDSFETDKYYPRARIRVLVYLPLGN